MMTLLYDGVKAYPVGAQYTGVIVTCPAVPVWPPATGAFRVNTRGGWQVVQLGLELADPLAGRRAGFWTRLTRGTSPRGCPIAEPRGVKAAALWPAGAAVAELRRVPAGAATPPAWTA